MKFHQISTSDVRVSINNLFYKLYENLRTRNRTPTHLLPFSGLQFTPAGFSWLQHRPRRIQKLCPRNDSFHSEKSQISTITVLLQVIFDEINNELFIKPKFDKPLSLIYSFSSVKPHFSWKQLLKLHLHVKSAFPLDLNIRTERK